MPESMPFRGYEAALAPGRGEGVVLAILAGWGCRVVV